MLDFFKGTVTPRDWLFVGVMVGIAVLLFSGFYFVFYAKQNEKLAGLQAELVTKRSERKVALETKRNIDALRQESEKMERLVELFEERLPEEREIPNLLQKFERRGDDLGLRVGLVALPTTSDARKETIPYEVTALGTFHQIVSFINMLERDERYLKVSDLDIQEEEAGVSEATFILSTFRFIQPATEQKEQAS